MQQSNHPDDERLAALAASEPDAVADASLVSHVSACARCSPLVKDLRTLHSALAELPDIQPSRPLRLLPVVPEPTARGSRWVGFLRGITGPAMAVAILFIVVGAFGTAFSSGFGAAGGAATYLSRDQAGAAAPGASARVPVPANSESVKAHTALPGSSGSYPVSGSARSPGASATASASPTANDRLQATYGSNNSAGGLEGEPVRPPFGLMLGAGVVLLAAAFVARGYLRRRSPA